MKYPSQVRTTLYNCLRIWFKPQFFVQIINLCKWATRWPKKHFPESLAKNNYKQQPPNTDIYPIFAH